jgi:hypothetical protein
LEVQLGLLGVTVSHSRPYHPQTCGKVERFHQTMKKWLAAQPPADTVAGLQRQLSRFASYYNTVRPHRALDRRTPLQAYQERPKAVPTGPIIPAHYRLQQDKIDRWGAVTLRYNSRLHHIGLSVRLAGTPVSLLIDDRHIRVIHRHTGQLLRQLILDPRHDYQPAAYHQDQPKAPPAAARPLPPISTHQQRPQPRSRQAAGHPPGHRP